MNQKRIFEIAEQIKDEYINEINQYIGYKYILESSFKIADMYDEMMERLLELQEESYNSDEEQEDDEAEIDDLDEEEIEEPLEEYDIDILNESQLDEDEAYYWGKIKNLLEDLDQSIAEEIIEKVRLIKDEPEQLKKINIICSLIEEFCDIENDEIDDDLYELMDKIEICSLILNTIGFSATIDDITYPNEWCKFDITEIAKIFAVDNVEIEPEYMQIIYNIYYKKCKTPISKLGIKLSYYNRLLINKIYKKETPISEKELIEMIKLGIFQKCLDNNYYVLQKCEGPFLSQFNDYIINEDKLPDNILESDVNMINYLFESLSTIDVGLDKIELDVNEELNSLLQEAKDANDSEELEKIARDRLFKNFIEEKKNQVLEKRKNDNLNIPTDVFYAVLINSCASPDTISKAIRKFNINKNVFHSKDIFELMTILVYVERNFTNNVDGDDLEQIGSGIYNLINQNKGKEEVKMSNSLKIKLEEMFEYIYKNHLLPNLDIKKEDVEL